MDFDDTGAKLKITLTEQDILIAIQIYYNLPSGSILDINIHPDSKGDIVTAIVELQ